MIKFLSLGGDSLSKTDIRGLKIDNITMSEAVLMTENALENGKKQSFSRRTPKLRRRAQKTKT